MTEAKPIGTAPDAEDPSKDVATEPLPTRVSEYLALSKVRPKAFLTGLAAAKIDRFERDDEEQALAMLLDRPELTRRLAELVHTAAKSRRSRTLQKVTDATVRIGGWVARRLAQRAFGLEGEDLTELRSMTMALAENVARAQSASEYKGLEPFSLFKLWIWHALARGLSLDDAVEAARKIGNGGRTNRSNLQPEKETVVELLFSPSSPQSKLSRHLALTAPAMALAQERAAELDRLQANCTSLERRLTDCGSKWEASQHRATELTAALDAAEHRVRQLERDVLDERASHGHRLRNARGNFIGFLEGEICIRLENAMEAISTKPPHLDIAQDRLKAIGLLVNSQIEKLKE